jgi:hypothetical protein
VEYRERLLDLSQQFSRKLTVRPALNDPEPNFYVEQTGRSAKHAKSTVRGAAWQPAMNLFVIF